MHWCRWPIAAAVAVTGYLAMAPDQTPLGHARWSCRRVRQWLAAEDSPLLRWRRAGPLPPVQVDLRTSPPLDRAANDALAAACTEGLAAGADGARTLLLPVHVGDFGVHAELALPDGSGAVLAVTFPSSWLALGVSVAGAIAVLGWPRRRIAASPAEPT